MGARSQLTRLALICGAFTLLLATSALSPAALRAQEAPVRWRADPGLEGMQKELASDPWIFSHLPGIGDPRSRLPDTLLVWLVSEFGPREELPDLHPEAWVDGIAIPSRNMIVLRATSGRQGLRELRQTFRHEVAHLALSAATGGNTPRWLQEGYAQFAAGSWGADEAWRLQVAFMRGGQSLHALALRFPRDRDSASLAYLLSYTAVAELLDLAGEAGLSRTFAGLAGGSDLDSTLRAVFGITEAQFEERWRRRVASRYGWLYALSRASVFWFALTLALLLLGYRRRRYIRQRWEALRRAETAADREERPGADPNARSLPLEQGPAPGRTSDGGHTG
jgi:hypothetical protein